MKSQRTSEMVLSLFATGILFVCPLAVLSQTVDRSPQHRVAPWNVKAVFSRKLEIGGATIEVDLASETLALDTASILLWIQDAAQAVTSYYGRFPVSRARILIVSVPGARGIVQGTTWGDVGGVGGFTRIRLGQYTTEKDLSDDWKMTHELVHMAFPSLPDNEHWMEEGLATYVEPIARIQSGKLSAKQVWGDMVHGIPQGEPNPDDRGLNRTHTWGRTYWGGAMFCLVADVTIRQESDNRKGLQDALRAIVAAGATIDKESPLLEVLQIGDRATGTSVLTDMYKKWSYSPEEIDLYGLWDKLGIKPESDGIAFKPDAPLAGIRKSIASGGSN